MKETATIYALIDPRDNSVRYVGQSRKIANRISNHRLGQFDGTQEWVSELKSLGLEMTWAILEQASLDDALSVEAKWIAHYQTSGAALLNRQAGRPFGTKRPSGLESWTGRLNREDLAELAELLGGVSESAAVREAIDARLAHERRKRRAVELAAERGYEVDQPGTVGRLLCK